VHLLIGHRLWLAQHPSRGLHDQVTAGVDLEAIGALERQLDGRRIDVRRNDKVVLEPMGVAVMDPIDAWVYLGVGHARITPSMPDRLLRADPAEVIHR